MFGYLCDCRGSVTLRDVNITSQGMASQSVTVTCPGDNHSTILPGSSINCTGTYTVTPTDLDRGYLYFWPSGSFAGLQNALISGYVWAGSSVMLTVVTADNLVLDVLGGSCIKTMASK